MIDTIVCIGCGTPKGRKTSKHGWATIQMSAPGLGRRYYRNCGCMSEGFFEESANDLFNELRNLSWRVDAMVNDRARKGGE